MLTFIFAFFFTLSAYAKPIVVGSKKFTESVILAEIATQSLVHIGMEVQHKRQVGGTRILWNALLSGDIDVYADYTGTLAEEILQTPIENFEDLSSKLSQFGIGVFPPLGFNNTYAIGMKRDRAEELNIKKISDLTRFPNIKMGWGEEFRSRVDGWVGLKKHYRLPQRFVRGMDHDIAYRALGSGDVEVTDLYTTDAEIAYYDITVLKDDLGFFPRYDALFIYRIDRAEQNPQFTEALSHLSGKISEEKMIDMNRRAKIDKASPEKLASSFLNETFGWSIKAKVATRTERMTLRTFEHLKLTILSLLLAVIVAVPLGIISEKFQSFGKVVLWTVGIVQTVPALALLVILIRPLNLLGLSGIGDTPALIALFLYSLLPIVRSTHSGFQQIPVHLREAQAVLGLRVTTRLFHIELPLALPSILSGIKISAVMNVGFATLGALVGAGGYGQPILTGIRLDDYALILEGALPAAVLALLAQQFFDWVESRLVSPGLKP